MTQVVPEICGNGVVDRLLGWAQISLLRDPRFGLFVLLLEFICGPGIKLPDGFELLNSPSRGSDPNAPGVSRQNRQDEDENPTTLPQASVIGLVSFLETRRDDLFDRASDRRS